jgi:broad specificity phosphatase PhoE
MEPAALDSFYTKYGKEKVEQALELLNYKHPTTLPKCDETGAQPILYVFRHGQTVDNANNIFSGWRDSPLTALGEQQAQQLAPKLKAKKIGMLITSDQTRSIKTMQIAIAQNSTASKLDIVKDPRIKERCYGLLQGHSKLEVQLENHELLAMERRSYDFVPPEGESIAMVVKRVYEVIEELKKLMLERHINVAVSCHGNSIRGFRKYFEQLTEEQTATVETPLAQDYAAYEIR